MVRRLKQHGLLWRVGPFVVRLSTKAPDFAATFHLLYEKHRLVEEPFEDIADFNLELVRGSGLRRWWRPKVFMAMDGLTPLSPFPLDHAFPLFEWGFNYGIATRANQYLILHTAVVARGERALLLPGIPGSGKSTLCAALVLKGWRLLSDEFALIRPASGAIVPLPRSIALKNESIDIIRAFDSKAVLGPVFPKTRKGSVAHLRPTDDSMQAEDQMAWPAWVVSPQFCSGVQTSLDPLPKDHGFLRLASNAFNYELQGSRGFQAVAQITRSCPFFDLKFGNLDEAVTLLETLIL
ncbi:MAG: HprK-related kinase A [Magnetococcales bacterium]|nr:HprK-related kinase A [Magnetococcales bacterium]MBF0438093.1 HprK-related kinase A [Magnetococcales bacterium]